MGIFKGLGSYTAGVTRMSNVPPRSPSQNRIQTAPPNPSSNPNPLNSSFTKLPTGSFIQPTDSISSSVTINQGAKQPSQARRSFPTMSRSGDISLGKRSSNATDEEDDDEEVEIKISPTGSVLAPSPNPYDKTQKLRQANAQLMASRLPAKPPGKVRFNESVIASDEPSGDHAVRSKKPKTVVTLPPTLKKN